MIYGTPECRRQRATGYPGLAAGVSTGHQQPVGANEAMGKAETIKMGCSRKNKVERNRDLRGG